MSFSKSPEEQREAPKERRGRRFQFTIRQLLIATAILAGVLGVTRWIYLARPWAGPKDDSMAAVTLCEKDANSMNMELRMRKPFTVVLTHRLEKLTDGASVEVRSEVAAAIPSSYDVLRGNFVRFRVSSGKQIAVEANNKTIWIAPWSVADASNTNWERISEALSFRDSCGIIRFGELAAGKDLREIIDLRAGTTGY